MRASFDGLAVPAERLTAGTLRAGSPRRRCCASAPHSRSASRHAAAWLLGPTPLDDELAPCRAELDRLDPETIFAPRAAAGELAVRAAAALSVAEGGSSLLVAGHAQRLAREAFFTLVYALRPESKEQLLSRLGAAGT